MSTQQQRIERFRELHQRDGAFVIPNPWDAGSARILQSLGFEALATTSSGFAQTLGRLDGQVSLDEKLAHCRLLADATEIPINVDFENGFAHLPHDIAHNFTLVAATGVAGASIEDWSGGKEGKIYEHELAVERVRAAAEANAQLAQPLVLTARAENLIHGIDDLDDTVRRLNAYAEAGADVLFAPGLRNLEQVRQVVAAVDRPLNVLAPFVRGATVAQLAEAGAKRLSTGGALPRATLAPLLAAGHEMLEQGTFGWLSALPPGPEVARLLSPKT